MGTGWDGKDGWVNWWDGTGEQIGEGHIRVDCLGRSLEMRVRSTLDGDEGDARKCSGSMEGGEANLVATSSMTFNIL